MGSVSWWAWTSRGPPPVVGLGPLRGGAAGAGDGERVLVGVDLEVARLDPGQLGDDRDPVAAGVEVHRREAGGGEPARGREGAGEAVHLVLEAAQFAEGIAAEEADGAHGGHGSFLP